MAKRNEPFIRERHSKLGVTYQVYIRTPMGSITKSFSEKKYGSARIAHQNAVLFKNKTMLEVANKTVFKEKTTTVNDIFEEYIENTPISCNTKNKHEKLYRKFVTHGNKPIQELTRADILNDLNAMVNSSSDDLITRVYTIYKKDIVETALNKEIIYKDLTAGLRRPKSRIIKTKKSTTTDRETVLLVERKLLESKTNKFNAQMIVDLIELLYYTGMRPAEAEALTKDDIFPNYISVNKQLGSNENERYVVTRTKTDASIRQVPIHPSLRPILNRLLQGKEEFIFHREDGRHLDSDFVGTIICKIAKEIGVDFNLYRLRHLVATSLVTNNVDPKTTITLLGHTNYDMSLDYSNTSEELKSKAIGLLS